MIINFTKMHGLGNDFMVLDAIHQSIQFTPEQIRLLADRHFGVGFDQLLLVESASRANADFTYRIFNADGSEVAQCGNGARCFARFVRDKQLSMKNPLCVDTKAGQLLLAFTEDDLITVNMGVPKHQPAEIPLLIEAEALRYKVNIQGQDYYFGAVSMGNPHAVLLVDDIHTAPVNEIGRILESHALFPERANIGFMQIVDRATIKLRVFERGAGETLACGSGACAAVVVGIEYGLLAKQVTVQLTGGELRIEWAGRGSSVLMNGSAVSVFEGQIDCHFEKGESLARP